MICKGLYTLVLEKKGIFTIFFWKNNTIFFLNKRLFIFTCHKVFYDFFRKKIFIIGVTIVIVPKPALSERRIFYFKQNFFFLGAKTESSDVQKSNFLKKRSPFL